MYVFAGKMKDHGSKCVTSPVFLKKVSMNVVRAVASSARDLRPQNKQRKQQRGQDHNRSHEQLDASDCPELECERTQEREAAPTNSSQLAKVVQHSCSSNFR
jgi:hypothetical protein